MNMVKVSVVIPVYNGEKHLRQCLDSVCNQTLKDIEIICVDDGSTDSSYEILQEYKGNDARVQIYKQQNLYAGAARNLGKSHATGEYLVFWDCDDFFELKALELMYEKAHSLNADVCVCGASDYYQDLERLDKKVPHYLVLKKTPETDVFSRKTNEEYILNFTNAAAWNKIFRRAYIEELGLDFKEIRNGNDAYFTVNAICLAERITTVNKALVNYRTNQTEGLVSSLAKSPLTPIQTWMDAANDLRAKNAFPEKSFANKAIGSMLYMLRNIQQCDAFFEAVEFLQKEGLKTMGIYSRDEDFFYNEWHKNLVKCMEEGSPQDVQTFISYMNYMQLRKASAEKRTEKQNKNKAIKEKKNLELENQKLKEEKDELLKKEVEMQTELEQLRQQLKEIENSRLYKLGKFIGK